MRTINTFPTNAFDEMRQKVGSTTPDETDLLTDCYQLTRRIAGVLSASVKNFEFGQAVTTRHGGWPFLANANRLSARGGKLLRP